MLILHIVWQLLTLRQLVARLPAEVAGQQNLLPGPGVELQRNGKLELRVGVRALGSGRTKSGKVVQAEDLPDVSVTTRRSVTAEATFVPLK